MADDSEPAELFDLSAHGVIQALPPLRIHHLMACAAVAAVQLTLWRASFPQAANQISLANAAITVLGQGLSAIGLTLAIFSVYWQWKGYAGLVQPGQWLLVSFAFSAVRFYLTMLLLMRFSQPFRQPNAGAANLWMLLDIAILVGTYVLPFLFFCWCAWRVADTLPWRLVFIVFAIAPVISSGATFGIARWWSASTVLFVTYAGRGLTTLFVETWAIVVDAAARRERFWTHWVGIGLSIISQLLTIGASAVYFFSSP